MSPFNLILNLEKHLVVENVIKIAINTSPKVNVGHTKLMRHNKKIVVENCFIVPVFHSWSS